jgi:hypothetical protein
MTCGEPSEPPCVRASPGPGPPASPDIKSKSPAKRLVFARLFSAHSYRRISTGKRRDAARAGINVAPTEMLIATTAIHKPSKTLG